MMGANEAWRQRLAEILGSGKEVSPRGKATLELLHAPAVICDMGRACVTQVSRKLSYSFQAAEALWVLSGSNKLAPLTKHVARMAEFSDDGETLAGAYGPPVIDQLPYVIRCLLEDESSRQAILTTWRPRPMASKDIPCTIAMSFMVRGRYLHQQVYMRSSDAWLGVPYDLFTFSCIGLYVCCALNRHSSRNAIFPGQLALTAASSHLYEPHYEAARKILVEPADPEVKPVPEDLVVRGAWDDLSDSLSMICGDYSKSPRQQKPIWEPRP